MAPGPALARALRPLASLGFKHWPLRNWPEGMAVIGVTVAPGGAPSLSHGWQLLELAAEDRHAGRRRQPTTPFADAGHLPPAPQPPGLRGTRSPPCSSGWPRAAPVMWPAT